ncbi:MAG: DEAD/DEAH box helicase family protein [Clostridia bacterium]|nr:DEAD/DEAH box helicase family protein [Clostridia bacterium]
MLKPKINIAKKVVPMIYAYTTPGITYHDGYIKIGYTEQDVDKRIYEQTHTAGVKANKEWQGTAIYDDGSGESFKDHDFHRYLRRKGVKQPQDEGNEYFDEDDKNEWFHIEPKKSHEEFTKFKQHEITTDDLSKAIPYKLREEQEAAVYKTMAYRLSHKNGEFLWNAKPRFGKTLAVYDLCKRLDAHKVLIVTNRPTIANSWYQDYIKFLGRESGYLFVSNVQELREKNGVFSREEFSNFVIEENKPNIKFIEFVSLQDLKGSIYFGGLHDKLQEVNDTNWDLLVIDEAHEGVDTYKTDVAFERITREFTLHLSGTPFKALADSKFNDDAIFNWTYADEQNRKENWDETNGENPYEVMPKLNLYTYQMSEIIKDELSQGIEINGETEEYAFDLNEFFSTNNGRFVYNSSVDKFLDNLTLCEKFPFSTDELRNELKHTFWILDRVESAKALARKLEEHPIFKDYEIVLAAGDGRLDEEDALKASYNKVVEAIENHDKTITISVGQLTTGVTIPEWTGVLILANIKSPSLYMQAAFRAQNPWLYTDGSKYFRKENAYVFDFDPARTLTIFEQFANDLAPETSSGKGTLEERKKNIRNLLNFFPVIGEDENGELIELDPEKVLTIPRKIRSMEVVRRGFMSNFLFQNISQIFGGMPKEVMDIINNFEAIEEPAKKVNFSEEVKEDLQLDDDGNVNLSDDYVLNKQAEIFGNKIYETSKDINDAVKEITQEDNITRSAIEDLKQSVKEGVKTEIIDNIKEEYADKLKASDEKRIQSILNNATDRLIDKTIQNYQIEKNVIEKERTEALQSRFESGKSTEEINEEFDKKQKEQDLKLQTDFSKVMQDFVEKSKEEAVRTVETNIKEKEKNVIEEGIRDHLRGFSRTIPSFLMAYGDDTVTLATFDSIIPGNVFEEVTSITLEQFRFLRDGGKYTDEETGEERDFKGNLFDPVVFDDSVKEFLALKKKLANYFDEKSIEDIFDYIPPQKTNQIYTPKMVVKNMVDMLEKENPGCFDDPNKTFIDLYMKSGLYIAEIVKRLYQSEKMKELFPDKEERLKHIFEKQVFGLAPTEIIYKIATSFILGFDEDVKIKNHNLRQADSLPYAKDGKLEDLLETLYGKDVR